MATDFANNSPLIPMVKNWLQLLNYSQKTLLLLSKYKCTFDPEVDVRLDGAAGVGGLAFVLAVVVHAQVVQIERLVFVEQSNSGVVGREGHAVLEPGDLWSRRAVDAALELVVGVSAERLLGVVEVGVGEVRLHHVHHAHQLGLVLEHAAAVFLCHATVAARVRNVQTRDLQRADERVIGHAILLDVAETCVFWACTSFILCVTISVIQFLI